MPLTQPMNNAWTIQSTNTAQAGRFHWASLLTPAPNGPIAYRDGVINGASTIVNGLAIDLSIVVDSPTPSMNVRAWPGHCVISRANQGSYALYSNNTVTLAAAAANATNPRWDLVVARIYDAAIGDATTGPQLEIITGTPSATPALPALPVGAIPLAKLVVAANATAINSADITDLRKSAGIRGGIRPLLPGDLASDVGAYYGECRFRAGQIEWWDGAAWHGTMPLRYQVTPPALGAVTVATTITTISVPDPGWAYVVEASASGEVSSDAGSRMDLIIRVGSTTGEVISLGVGANGVANYWANSSSRPSATQTGAKLIYLMLEKAFGTGGSFPALNSHYKVTVSPA